MRVHDVEKYISAGAGQAQAQQPNKLALNDSHVFVILRARRKGDGLVNLPSRLGGVGGRRLCKAHRG